MRNLKKFLIVCTFFVALALLAGCASEPAPEIAATEAPTATPSPTATPAPISFEAAAEANRAELRTFSDYGSVFSAVQESFNKLLASLGKVKQTDAETAGKLEKALRAVLGQFQGRIGAG